MTKLQVGQTEYPELDLRQRQENSLFTPVSTPSFRPKNLLSNYCGGGGVQWFRRDAEIHKAWSYTSPPPIGPRGGATTR
jgi:hypothetical protein